MAKTEKDANVLVVYGASDDCIEIEGLLSEEYPANWQGADLVRVMVDDTTYVTLHLAYTDEWRIEPTTLGNLVTVIRAPGEDTDGPRYDEHGCPRYSDKAIIDMQNIEARRVTVHVIPTDGGSDD